MCWDSGGSLRNVYARLGWVRGMQRGRTLVTTCSGKVEKGSSFTKKCEKVILGRSRPEKCNVSNPSGEARVWFILFLWLGKPFDFNFRCFPIWKTRKVVKRLLQTRLAKRGWAQSTFSLGSPGFHWHRTPTDTYVFKVKSPSPHYLLKSLLWLNGGCDSQWAAQWIKQVSWTFDVPFFVIITPMCTS